MQEQTIQESQQERGFTVEYQCNLSPSKCVYYVKSSMRVVAVFRWHLYRLLTLLEWPAVSMETDKRNASYCREYACGNLWVASLDKCNDVLFK